jgi:tryptophan synthase beta subunit
VDGLEAEYVLVCLSGRGDKDLDEALRALSARQSLLVDVHRYD